MNDIRLYHGDCAKFVEDMLRAGLQPHHYRGRNFYEGPGVVVPDLQDALQETKVRCQWDNMGRGWVVYPIASDKGDDVEPMLCGECDHLHWYGIGLGYGRCPLRGEGCECEPTL
jgi:hypothetical protein